MNYVIYLLAGLFLVGCTSPYSPIQSEDKNAFGFEASQFEPLYQPKSKATLVMIHGMCEHKRDWAEKKVKRLAKIMGAKQENKPNTFKYKLGNGRGGDYFLDKYQLIKGDYELSVYAFNYSNFNNFRALYKGDKYKKAWFNEDVKNELINDCLSDVTTYAGARGEDVRNAFRWSLEYIDSNLESGEKLFFLSESLGSKILRDSLLCRVEGQSDERNKLLAFNDDNNINMFERATTIFMLSNQLPILNELDSCKDKKVEVKNKNEEKYYIDNFSGGLIGFFEARNTQEENSQSFTRSGAPKVVSFTDPNDLLSYKVSEDDYSKNGVPLLNVPVSNTYTYFGAISNPESTHIEYLKNEEILQLITCGTTNCQ